MSVTNLMAASDTKVTSQGAALIVIGMSLAVLGALTGCSGGSDEPAASAPAPTTSDTNNAPQDWQDDPSPAEEKDDMWRNAVVFADGYAFEISRQAGIEKATVGMQNKALKSAARDLALSEYGYDIAVQNLSTAGKATVAISKDGLCATFTVPNSNRGSMSDLTYEASPATATAGKGFTAPTCD